MHEGTLHPVEGVKVEPVDTTGAGDMYAAGILYGLTHGLSGRRPGGLRRTLQPGSCPCSERAFRQSSRAPK
jgi:sugar/nucleoside kinase (ribokinase family)